MLLNIPLYQSIKAALNAEIIKHRMESNMHKADILARPKKLSGSCSKLRPALSSCLCLIFLYTFKVKLFEEAYSYFILF